MLWRIMRAKVIKITKRSQLLIRVQNGSFRQIEANRRNARLSTVLLQKKARKVTSESASSWANCRNCGRLCGIRHGGRCDFDAQSVVERELVLRLASLLWRLRRDSLR